MKNRFLILSVLIATLFACSTDSMINDDLTSQEENFQSNKSAVERPIKINIVEGDYNLFPGDGQTCTELVLNAIGEGTISHLGLSTLFEEWCYNGSPDDLGTRSITITAANGDELRGTHSTILWTSATSFEETLNFDGGTGRFENATGVFYESVVITPESQVSGTFVLSGEGTINY